MPRSRARPTARVDALGRDGRVRRDGAEVARGKPGGQVRRGPLQPDHEPVAARVTPAIRCAPPAMYSPPHDVLHELRANDPTLGLSARSIARLNAAAVTGSFDGGEKRNPRRIRERVRAPVGGDRRAARGDLGLEPRALRVTADRDSCRAARRWRQCAGSRWSSAGSVEPGSPRHQQPRHSAAARGARWLGGRSCPGRSPRRGRARPSRPAGPRRPRPSPRPASSAGRFARRAAEAVRDPYRALPDGDAGGAAPDRDRVGHGGAVRVDPRDRVVLRVRHPHRAAHRRPPPPGPCPTGVVPVTALALAGSMRVDRVVHVVRDPDAAGAGGDRARAVPHRDRSCVSRVPGVHPRDGPIGASDPHRAVADRHRVRARAGRSPRIRCESHRSHAPSESRDRAARASSGGRRRSRRPPLGGQPGRRSRRARSC